MEYIKTEDISRMWEGSYSMSWSLSETVPPLFFPYPAFHTSSVHPAPNPVLLRVAQNPSPF